MHFLQKDAYICFWALCFFLNSYTTPLLQALPLKTIDSDSTDIVAIDSLYFSGDSLLKTGNYAQARQDFEKALSIALAEKDSLAIGKLYNGIAATHQYQKQYKEAVRNYLETLDYLNEQDSEEFIKVQSNLGALYAGLKDFDKAKTHFEHALQLIQEENTLKLQVMNNLFGVYTDLKEYAKADQIAEEAVALSDTLENEALKATLYTNLSNSYIQRERWEDALQTGIKGLEIRRRLEQKTPVITLNNIGYAYQQSDRPNEAISYYKEALNDAEGEERLQLLLNLKNATQQTGDLKTTLQYFERYNHLKDSLTALNQKAEVAEITEQYKSAQQQLEIENLQAENNLQKTRITQQRFGIGAVIVISLLAIGLVYIWIQRNQTRQALEKSRIQQRFLLTQLNPHFIFNALQSIQNFIFNHKTDASMKYLSNFSTLIRSVLEHSDQDIISLEEEIEMIRNFLHLQQLNHNNSFAYEIRSDAPEHTEGLYIPVMLIQPFVENAVIHGVKDIPDGKILVTFKKSGDVLEATISDNGKGFEKNSTQRANSFHRSMGREIVSKRIQEFNKTNSETISVKTQPFREHPEFPGTKVTIRIPIFTS